MLQFIKIIAKNIVNVKMFLKIFDLNYLLPPLENIAIIMRV